MHQRSIKVWTGVGSYLLSGMASAVLVTPSQPALSQLSPSGSSEAIHSEAIHAVTTSNATDRIAQGGEGGEGGEGGSTPAPNQLSGAALVSALQSGGYIIYFRHAQTEQDYADQVSAKMGDCSTQRMLSETGWQQARAIGRAFEELQIPVGQVYSSEYCRAWQTADLAFGTYEKTAALNFAPAEEYTDAQVAQMRDAVMPLLTAVPTSGTNTVIVGHDDVFEAATGIYPEPQGVAYVLRPDGQGSFEIVSMVLPDAWATLGR